MHIVLETMAADGEKGEADQAPLVASRAITNRNRRIQARVWARGAPGSPQYASEVGDQLSVLQNSGASWSCNIGVYGEIVGDPFQKATYQDARQVDRLVVNPAQFTRSPVSKLATNEDGIVHPDIGEEIGAIWRMLTQSPDVLKLPPQGQYLAVATTVSAARSHPAPCGRPTRAIVAKSWQQLRPST